MSEGRYIRFSGQLAEQPERAPVLERLAVRSDARAAVTDWRNDALMLLGGTTVPALAPVAYAADGLAAGSWVCFATPVYYQAEMANVRMSAEACLPLAPAAATALVEEFNFAWGGTDATLQCAHGRLYCRFDRALAASTCDPSGVAGQHLETHLPSGPDARRVRLLMSELEMWLHGSLFNRARSAAGAVPINGLWLWGGGPPPEVPFHAALWSAGRDCFFDAIAQRTRSAGAGLVILDAAPGSTLWQDSGAAELARARDDLAAGRIAQLHLSGGATRFTVSAGSHWRWWRRVRPWWELFV